MLYKEVINEVYLGKMVKSSECYYIKPNGESPVYWKWISEDTWTTGEGTFDDCVNESEKEGLWEIVR